MKIALRKQDVFIDYQARFTDDEIQSPPYNYVVVDIPNEVDVKLLSYQDFENNQFIMVKYNEKLELIKQQEYRQAINNAIRERYTIDDELAILRQKDIKVQEYNDYYNHVEECKRITKSR